MVQWLDHCVANLVVVGSNAARTCVCGMYFPRQSVTPWLYVPDRSNVEAKLKDIDMLLSPMRVECCQNNIIRLLKASSFS